MIESNPNLKYLLYPSSRMVATIGWKIGHISYHTDLAVKGDLDLPHGASKRDRKIKLPTHCYQKAFGTAAKVVDMLRLLPHTIVEDIDSDCCAMAGSFDYEKEH